MATYCCNPWNNSTADVCGTFEEPVVEDLGQCAPYRVKRTCEAPTLPVAKCADDTYQTVYDPTDVDHPFKVIAKLFDASCGVITDASGNPITLVIT